jgi:phosphate uptake regulator
MLEILSEASGVIVAASILYAARELRRIGDAVRDLDVRVGRLELWMQRTGLSERPGRSDESISASVGGRDRQG